MRADADADDVDRSGTPTGPGDADDDAGTGDGEAGTGTAAGEDAGTAVDRALTAFRAGEPVCVHDFADREGETDLMYPASAVDEAAVAHMRNDAGGLICVAVTDPVADAFGLPFLADALDHPAVDDDPAYDDRSSFSLPVNHRETFTGITDADRALTITEVANAANAAAADPGAYSPEEFAASFRAPGHVHVLRGARSGLNDRVGHTELGLALAEAVDSAPAAVVCEMLDDETGDALAPEDAAAYAARHDIPYVEGAALVEALR
ncbi:3,4-dihydroxy 2-butanone 4-phosphate synthase [Halorubrum alkaliphilum]|uniref:3,4-dihydroxy-2-butanone 4-phosphate synthase n=1 Tax=Halorubrum alkaliphilum TaxID=261290 RepID=A0A8T4GG53_9EURY|nr:3,4-dihydroxy-2-butanone-4-phosphate synthase [Halorubrum alkaliphilum]MBP1923123.1 3,4-dihydroxy 2-butanone 4-phosphate synthase [Halorubrum alkaliphilum]